jgi:hypothetical protein
VGTREIVEQKLATAGPCRHCNQPTSLRFIQGEGMLIAVYVCPSGYVSRFIDYGDSVDVAQFKNYLSKTAGKVKEVKDDEIRVATHYAWDMGVPASNPKQVVIRGAFWTQNYGRNANKDPDRPALFLCTSCQSKTFVQPLSGKGTLCEDCSKREGVELGGAL